MVNVFIPRGGWQELLLASMCCIVFSCSFVKPPSEKTTATLTLSVLERKQEGNHISAVVGGRIRLAKGWHTYWINPGDAGLPPRITCNAPEGFQIGNIRFPVPQKIIEQTIVVLGYRDSVWFLVDVDASGSLKGAIEIHAALLVCDMNRCVPVNCTASVVLSPSNGREFSGKLPAFINGLYPRIDGSIQASYRVTSTTIDFSFTRRENPLYLSRISAIFPVSRGVIDLVASPRFAMTGNLLRVSIARPQPAPEPPDTVECVLVLGKPDSEALLCKAVSESVDEAIPSKQ